MLVRRVAKEGGGAIKGKAVAVIYLHHFGMTGLAESEPKCRLTSLA